MKEPNKLLSALTSQVGRKLLTGITVTTPNGSPSTLKSGDVVSVRVAYTITAGGGFIPSSQSEHSGTGPHLPAEDAMGAFFNEIDDAFAPR